MFQAYCKHTTGSRQRSAGILQGAPIRPDLGRSEAGPPRGLRPLIFHGVDIETTAFSAIYLMSECFVAAIGPTNRKDRLRM